METTDLRQKTGQRSFVVTLITHKAKYVHIPCGLDWNLYTSEVRNRREIQREALSALLWQRIRGSGKNRYLLTYLTYLTYCMLVIRQGTGKITIKAYA